MGQLGPGKFIPLRCSDTEADEGLRQVLPCEMQDGDGSVHLSHGGRVEPDSRLLPVCRGKGEVAESSLEKLRMVPQPAAQWGKQQPASGIETPADGLFKECLMSFFRHGSSGSGSGQTCPPSRSSTSTVAVKTPPAWKSQSLARRADEFVLHGGYATIAEASWMVPREVLLPFLNGMGGNEEGPRCRWGGFSARVSMGMFKPSPTVGRKGDETMHKGVRIADLFRQEHQYLGKAVQVQGWVRTRRDSKAGVTFIELNDGSCLRNLQVVAETSRGELQPELDSVTTGSSLRVEGTVQTSPGREQAIELQAGRIELYGRADPARYPLQKKRHSFEFLSRLPISGRERTPSGP